MGFEKNRISMSDRCLWASCRQSGDSSTTELKPPRSQVQKRYRLIEIFSILATDVLDFLAAVGSFLLSMWASLMLAEGDVSTVGIEPIWK